MKKTLQFFGAVILIAVWVNTGCEWEDSGSFNTSRGAGSSVNFSGVYTAKEGQYLVGTNITQLLVNQVGNSVEAWDNNNSYYTGTVGSPGVVSAPDATGAYPTGAVMVAAQIYFSGKNEATDEVVSFVGVFRAVAVTDVEGTTITDTLTETDTLTDTFTSNEWFNIGTSTGAFGVVTEWTLEDVDTDDRVIETIETTTYEIDESNTKYVLEGSWIENGNVSSFTGWANAGSGSFGG